MLRYMLYRVEFELTTLVVIGTDCSYKSNYHMITTATALGNKSIQHYVITVVSDVLQVGSFFRVLRFPPPIKLTITI